MTLGPFADIEANKRAERLRLLETYLCTKMSEGDAERSMRYLRGELTLDEWSDNGRMLYWMFVFALTSLLTSAQHRLDDIDIRLLDICMASDRYKDVLHHLRDNPVLHKACDYALDHGYNLAKMYLMCCENCHVWLDANGRPTQLGEWLLAHLPAHFEELRVQMAAAMKRDPAGYAQIYFGSLVRLLLAGSPPPYDFVLEVVQQAPAETIGKLTVLLLEADYERFGDWGRHAAGPESPGGQAERAVILSWLLQYDPARHIELALGALYTPHQGPSYFTYHLQAQALHGLYAYDPERFFRLAAEACASKDEGLCWVAVAIVKARLPFEQARPLLQTCVASGNIAVALLYLRDALLKPQWEGRNAYAVSLLSHHSRKVREWVSGWLIQQGALRPDDLTLTLSDKKAAVRLVAVELLGKLGNERAHALLRERLAVEQDAHVQQAINSVVGIPEQSLRTEDDLRACIAAFTAEAEAAMAGVDVAAREIWEDSREGAPVFYWRTGEPLTTNTLIYLLYEQLLSRGMQPVVCVQRAQALVDRERSGEAALLLASRIRFAASVSDKRGSELFPLAVAVALGDDRLVPLIVKAIASNHISGKTARLWRAQLLEALGALGSDAALNAVYDVSDARLSSGAVSAAWKVLDATAAQRGLTQTELLDMIVPRLGMDEKGRRMFDYGPRQFAAYLGADGALRLYDDGGQAITTLPVPDASDDAAKAAAAVDEWQTFQTDLAAEMKRQTKRIGEMWAVRDTTRRTNQWQHLMPAHPLLRIFAINSIWVSYQPDSDEAMQSFRALEDGTLTDAEDNPVELLPSMWVRCAWSRELWPGSKFQGWHEHTARHRLKPPFSQL